MSPIGDSRAGVSQEAKRLNRDAHRASDVDATPFAEHHTLGISRNQASSGAHTHDGTDSNALLADVSITGSRATDAWRLSVIAALVKLGAVDGTSA